MEWNHLDAVPLGFLKHSLPIYHERRWRSDTVLRDLWPRWVPAPPSLPPAVTDGSNRGGKKKTSEEAFAIRHLLQHQTPRRSHWTILLGRGKRCWKIIRRSATARRISDGTFCNILALNGQKFSVFFVFFKKMNPCPSFLAGSSICADNDHVVD